MSNPTSSFNDWDSVMQQAPEPPQRGHRRSTQKKHHAWPWIVLAVLVAIIAFFGVLGAQLYSQAKQVKAHEEQALSVLSDMNGISDISKVNEISAKLPQVQQETKEANRIAHGFVWNVYSKLPWIGSDITTVQGMTEVVDSLTNRAVPQFVAVVDTLQKADLQSGDGTLNLQPILSTEQTLVAANDALQEQVTAYNKLPGGNISLISSTYDAGKTQLDSLAGTVNQLTNTFTMLPSLLGGNQTYAVMAVTPSETRSSGGLVGSVGELKVDNGKLSVGDFHSNGDYLKDTNSLSGALTDDEAQVFKNTGPMRMSFDIRDLAALPDTAHVATAMQSMWDRTSWGSGTPLSGILMMDPVFLQELIGITGNVQLSNGVTLTGENTAQYLLNTVYIDYPNDNPMMDSLFEEAATQSIDHMFANTDLTKLMKVGTALGQMAQERHFSMYSFDANVEKNIEAAGFTPSSPNSIEHPTIGVYLNEQKGDKMGWYLDRKAVITPTSCKNNAQTYHVEYEMKNTMTEEEVSTLPTYITGTTPGEEGWIYAKTLIYAPKGGSISNITATGTGTAEQGIKQVTMDGAQPYLTIAKLLPGQTLTFSFDVTVSSDAVSQLAVDQTPLNQPGSNVTYNKGTSCK